MEKTKPKFDLSYSKATLDMDQIEDTAMIAANSSMNRLRNLSEDLMRLQQEAFSARYLGNYEAYLDALRSIKSHLENLQLYSRNYSTAMVTLHYTAESAKRENIELKWQVRDELVIREAA